MQESGISREERAATYRDAFVAAVQPEDIGDIVRRIVARAKRGDLQAARLILDRACGANAFANWPTAEEAAREARNPLNAMLRLG